jgi:hypothetical protein
LYGGVDGEELLQLSIDDLIDCGVTAEADQNRILKEIWPVGPAAAPIQIKNSFIQNFAPSFSSKP